jgi:hypothetical protein
MAYYWLTPPSRAVFFISVLLAVLALLVRYAHVAKQSELRDTVDRLPAAIGWQLVQRLLATVHMLGQRNSVGEGAPSPCRLWFADNCRFADNCHINGRRRPGDVHSLAFSDRGLRITRRNVYDPTIIRRRAIVLVLGGEGGDRKAKHECGDEKKLSHLATFPFSAS